MGELHELGRARLRKQHELWECAELAMEARMAARLAQVVVADASEFMSHEDWLPRAQARAMATARTRRPSGALAAMSA